MALTLEWDRRIRHWERVMWNCIYQPVGEVDLFGFVTKAQLSAEDARIGNFEPMPKGTNWGAKWEYGWFKAEIVLDGSAKGKRVVTKIETGPEALVWVNGKAVGALDYGHKEITLSTSGEPGACYSILLESYAGHGVRYEGGGPVPYGVETVPEPSSAQVIIGKSTYGIWDEDLYQLALDFSTLYSLRGKLDPESLRVDEIDRALMETSLVVDVELPFHERASTVLQGRKILQPVLECKNGSTAPSFFAIGHAHLDIAWLWPLQESERKIARTISNTLTLMKEYPDYRYIQSQPHLFRMLKNCYPDIYLQFKEAVQQGKIIPEGGMWVEADTNITAGESLIRQFLHGKKFFKEEFGIESEILWLPDVFGYSGALPQIMRGCGINGFATQKINWAYGGGDPFPFNTFIWEGIDGSGIPAHIYNDYNNETNPGVLIDRWTSRHQKTGVSEMMLPFGHGDGGGGPTRDHLEYLKRTVDLEGAPRTRQASPVEFFEEVKRRGELKNRYVGELYFQCHRGTYTSQAKTKKGNRKSELAVRNAEIWGSIAATLTCFPYPFDLLDSTWKDILLNQFHDILPGSSIHRVYQEAEASFDMAIQSANQVADLAIQDLKNGNPSGSLTAMTVFNPLSWDRTELVKVHGTFIEEAGVQVIDGVPHIEVLIPSIGWKAIEPDKDRAQVVSIGSYASGSYRCLENEFLKVLFNEKGEIVSLLDKVNSNELASGPCNQFQLFKDVPGWFDAWDIDSMALVSPVATGEPVELVMLADGPLIAKLQLRRRLGQSTINQVISLRRGSRRIEFETTIDWQESHKLLKVAFPTTLHTTEGIHEIQFGHIRRPNHYSRPFDRDRFEVNNHKWSAIAEEGRGAAILNDCKYGINILGGTMNLTLLKSALAPDMNADKGIQTFTYAFYCWNGPFSQSRVVQESYELNCPVQVMPGEVKDRSIIRIDKANIVLEALKEAEDANGDLVLRLYDAMHTSTQCTVTIDLPFTEAFEANMLEVPCAPVPLRRMGDCEPATIHLSFRPFEIKTIRLKK